MLHRLAGMHRLGFRRQPAYLTVVVHCSCLLVLLCLVAGQGALQLRVAADACCCCQQLPVLADIYEHCRQQSRNSMQGCLLGRE